MGDAELSIQQAYLRTLGYLGYADAKYPIYWTLSSAVPEFFVTRVTKLYMLAFVST